MLTYFPRYFTNRAIYTYLAVVIVVIFMFFSHTMLWYWYVFGLVAVVGFFCFGNILTKSWGNIISTKKFTKKLFITAFAIRIIWVIFSYFFYIKITGQPFEFVSADAMVYHDSAQWIREALRNGEGYKPFLDYMRGGYSDVGYAVYLGTLYYIVGDSIFIARVAKALISAFTCVLIYKLAIRNFGESTGRIAAIFSMLMPNLIYYCGLHLKETEMVFLTVAFIERADFAIRNKQFSFLNLLLPVLLAGSLFFFRTVLGVTALFSFFTALVFAPGRTLRGWKRMILVVWVLLAIGYFMGSKIATEVEEVWAERHTNQQQSMDHRSSIEGGNKFVEKASSAIFAPAILILPFPTIVDTPLQDNQRLIHGGNYVKNILAFFVILALIFLIKDKKWRDHTLIICFLIAYLIVIALSKFAASERFHMPALPFFLMFAAYGLSRATNKTKKYYNMYIVLVFLVIIAWSWFKLAGRGYI